MLITMLFSIRKKYDIKVNNNGFVAGDQIK